MEISVKIDIEYFVELLIKRLMYWTSEEAIINAFSQMYQNLTESGAFENADVSKMGIMQIVDNDLVSNIEIIYKEEVSAEDWKALQDLGNGDLSEAESSLDSLEVNSGFLEVITDELALIRL